MQSRTSEDAVKRVLNIYSECFGPTFEARSIREERRNGLQSTKWVLRSNAVGVPNLHSLSNKDSENKHSLGNVNLEDQWISKFYLALSQNKYALFKS